MKTKIPGIVPVCSLLLFLSLAHPLLSEEIIVREVELRLVDESTLQPMAGILVYDVQQYYIPHMFSFFGLRIGEQKDEIEYRIREYRSDDAGIVLVPELRFQGKRNQYLYGQSIFINLEMKDKSGSDRDKAMHFLFLSDSLWSKFLYLVNDQYKAVEILSRPRPLGDNYRQLEKTKEYYTLLLNGHDIPPLSEKEKKGGPLSFFTGKEIFTIQMQRR